MISTTDMALSESAVIDILVADLIKVGATYHRQAVMRNYNKLHKSERKAWGSWAVFDKICTGSYSRAAGWA